MASGSNSGRYTRCPYYRWEYEARITCEDTYRHFECKAQKNAWMDMYCDSWDWMKCPYAADLTEAYERYEKGDEKALENHENEALRKEIKSIAMKLGHAERKIRKLTAKAEDLEKQKMIYFERYRKALEQLDEYEKKIAGQVQVIVDAYEARLAYMMAMFSDGTLNESDVEDWIKDKEFAIVKTDYGFEVVYKEETDEDGKDNIVPDAENEKEPE